jgi:hypothetical protein
VQNGAVTGFVQRDTSGQNAAYSCVHLQNIHVQQHVTAATTLQRNSGHQAATTPQTFRTIIRSHNETSHSINIGIKTKD